MKWGEIVLNVLFWVLTAWLITTSFSIQRQEIEIINNIETVRTVRDSGLVYQLITLILIAMVAFYLNLFNIYRLSHTNKNVQVVFVSVVLLIASFSLYSVLETLFFNEKFIPLNTSFTVGITLFYFTISSSYGLVNVWKQLEQRQQHLLLANKQAELTLMRNQLQPHFLFNALNNLLSLVDQEKSSQLSSSFEKLSNLLRYVIEENKSEKVPISSEIEFARNYCDLQLLRFEEGEVELRFDVTGTHSGQLVEPGLFISFIENAFKYGTEPESKNIISIAFNLSRDREIAFSILNKKLDSFDVTKGSGTGIASTKERLELVYPQKHQLSITDEEYFLVELKITTV